MLKSAFAATVMVAALSILPGHTQSESTETEPTQVDGNQIVRSVSMNDMRAITASFAHTIIEEYEEQNGFLVQTPNGFKYMVLLKACEENGQCQGMLIGSIHQLPEGVTWPVVNQVDMQADAFGVYVANDQLIIDRYFILSGGVRVEAFAYEVATLISTAPNLMARIGELAAAASG